MIKKHLPFIFIIIIAFLLRFYDLGTVPISPDWDEAALGYNAYSIIHTGRDEYGKLFPIILRSFDDYKPALYAYFTIPSVLVFGLNTFAVRFPSALFGTLTVISVYYVIQELFSKTDVKKTDKSVKRLALVTSFLLAISPWHLQFSRIAFEANVGLAFNVFGLLFFLKGLKRPWLLSFSTFLFACALYIYQSEKVFTPLFVFAMVFIFREELRSLPRKLVISSVVIGVLISLPLLLNTLSDHQALSRARGVSVFSESDRILGRSSERLLESKYKGDMLGLAFNNRRVVFAKQILSNYLAHFDLNWLFIHGDILRHHAPSMGLLYIVELPFLLIGIYQIFFGKWPKKAKCLVIVWFLIAPIPASVTTGVPHAVRTINFLPTFQIFIALGLLEAISFFSKKRGLAKLLITISFIICYAGLALVNFAYYLNQYFVQQNYENSKEWQYGYKEVNDFLKMNSNKFDKIVVSNQPHLEQSYMFFLYYLKYPPEAYHRETIKPSGGFSESHSFGKYEFRPIKWDEEKKEKNILYIGRPEDFTVGASVLEKIHFLDGREAILIVKGS